MPTGSTKNRAGCSPSDGVRTTTSACPLDLPHMLHIMDSERPGAAELGRFPVAAFSEVPRQSAAAREDAAMQARAQAGRGGSSTGTGSWPPAGLSSTGSASAYTVSSRPFARVQPPPPGQQQQRVGGPSRYIPLERMLNSTSAPRSSSLLGGSGNMMRNMEEGVLNRQRQRQVVQ